MRQKMANLKEVSKVLGVLTLAYPKSELKPGMAEVYSSLLSEIPNEILEAAAKQIMVENTFFPSIAELRNKSLELMHGSKSLPLPIEAYEFTVNYEEITTEITDEWTDDNRVICIEHKNEWLHPLVEKTAKLMGWPRLFPTDNPMADKAQFIKAYESLVNREIEQTKLLPDVKAVSEKYQLEISNLTKRLTA